MDIESALVSIILPTYNRAHLLSAAIDSVLAQTYQNWELIIWNDGSSDDTENVLRALSDPRIRCLTEDNHGQSYALNRSLEESQGEFIAFLDDDDQWLPMKLEMQVEVISEFPEIDLTFANFNNVDVEAKMQDVAFEQNAEGLAQLKTQRINEDWWLISEGFLEGVARENFIAFDSVMLTKNAIDIAGQFNESLKTAEDFEYWWRFGLAGMQAAYTEEILMNRNKYPGSLSGRSVGALHNRLITLDACRDLAAKREQPDLVELLEPLYRNTWHNLINAYGKEKDLQNAFSAFKQSLEYGFRPGALRLMAEAAFNTLKGNKQ